MPVASSGVINIPIKKTLDDDSQSLHILLQRIFFIYLINSTNETKHTFPKTLFGVQLIVVLINVTMLCGCVI